MNGVSLAARYGFPPNSLGYCGKGTFASALRGDLDGIENSKTLERELKKFKAHYAYLSLIARENDLEPFDPEVVEAFWIGNKLLENVSKESLASFIEGELFDEGQAPRAKKLRSSLPDGILPHHSFNVLFINFVSDSVGRTIENFDSCCITQGRVLSVSVDGKSVGMERDSISLDKQDFFFIKKTESRVSLEKNNIRFLQRVSIGDILSVHWGMAIERLSKRRAGALEKYTMKNIRACNSRF
jgi:hypothetical protein